MLTKISIKIAIIHHFSSYMLLCYCQSTINLIKRAGDLHSWLATVVMVDTLTSHYSEVSLCECAHYNVFM